jgi:hypothetical protein
MLCNTAGRTSDAASVMLLVCVVELYKAHCLVSVTFKWKTFLKLLVSVAFSILNVTNSKLQPNIRHWKSITNL